MRRLSYFFIPLFTIITLVFSMSPWFIGLLATPSDRIFGGVNRWSADYYIYLSFVETGQRGQFKEYHLTTTKPQEPIWIHGIYTLSGFLGKLAGLDAVAVYHLDRLILGGMFIIVLYFVYYSVFKSGFWSALALIFVFWIPGFPQTLDIFGRWDQRFLYEVQESNIVGRVTTPPHYLLGFIFFLLAILYFMKSTITKGFVKKGIILSLLAILITIVNPVNLLILLGTIGFYMALRLALPMMGKIGRIGQMGRIGLIRWGKEMRSLVGSGALLALGSLPVALYYRQKLSIFPWGPRSNALKFYVPGYPIDIKELVLSLGPALVWALIGMGWWMLRLFNRTYRTDRTYKHLRKWLLLFFSWLLVQFGLLVWAMNPSHGVDPLRFLQGLYYIPLAGLAVVGVRGISTALGNIGQIGRIKSEKKWAVFLMGLSFILTLPTLIISYREQLFMNTDYRNFTTLIYPTKEQYRAYKFMEKNTPFASGVLAFYEVTEVLPAFSGNTTERDIPNDEKTEFFTNQLSQDKAYQYLKSNGFSYVWVGYQEASVGFDPRRYPFLKQIFENKEVRVYRVISKVKTQKSKPQLKS